MKLSLSLLLSVYVGATAAAAGYSGLTVHLTDGQTVSVALHDQLSIRFTETHMIAAGGDTDIQIERNAISHFEHTDVNKTPEITEAPVSRRGDILEVSLLKPGQTVSLYTTEGQMVKSSQAGQDGTAAIDLAGLQTGVYLLSTPTSSVKINKK